MRRGKVPGEYYVILEKSRRSGGFRLARHELGEEESAAGRKRRRKEGSWTPHLERFRERARERREEQEAPEA
jgi:hypothetical protein